MANKNLSEFMLFAMDDDIAGAAATSTDAAPTDNMSALLVSAAAVLEPLEREPLYIVVPIIIIYGLIFVTGVLGNIGTCIVIARNRSMHTATNYYLFSLAVSDFFLLVSGVPQEINLIWYRYPPIYGGHLTCIFRALIAEISCNATVLTITAFTVERFVAICHPFLSHTMSKLSRAVRLIVVIWVMAIALALPQSLPFRLVQFNGHDSCAYEEIFFDHFFEISTFLFFFLPMTLITVLYVLIGFKLRASGGARLMKSSTGNEWQRRHQPGNATKSQRRVLKMLVAVVVAFCLCWAPFHAQRLVAIYLGDIDPGNPNLVTIYITVTYISGILFYLSTCINPLLYSIMSNKFREAFKAVLFRRRSAHSLGSQGSGTLRSSASMGSFRGGGGQRGNSAKLLNLQTVRASLPARKVSTHPLLSNSQSSYS